MEASRALDLVAAPEPPVLCEIGADILPQWWERLAPLVEKACAYSGGDYTPRGVAEAVMAGRQTMLTFFEGNIPSAVVIVSRAETNTGAVLYLNLLGGNLPQEWTEYVEPIRLYAQHLGCVKIRAAGRKGLLKKFPTLRLVGVIMEMEA